MFIGYYAQTINPIDRLFETNDFMNSCNAINADEGYLGFYNRTCGALSPKTVGPAVRTASAQTWRQWQVDIVDETATEQWGYLTTYYPEDWGEARYVQQDL